MNLYSWSLKIKITALVFLWTDTHARKDIPTKVSRTKKKATIKNRITLPRMQKPREKRQGKILMGEVKKKKMKRTKGVGQNENADTKKQTFFTEGGSQWWDTQKHEQQRRHEKLPLVTTNIEQQHQGIVFHCSGLLRERERVQAFGVKCKKEECYEEREWERETVVGY